MQLEQYQGEVVIAIGSTQGEYTFPRIEGTIKGYSSKIVAIPTGVNADVSLKDGGAEFSRPLDAAFSEVTTNTDGIMSKILPVDRNDPGEIKAIVSVAATQQSEVKVKVVIWYLKGDRARCQRTSLAGYFNQ